MRLLRRRKKEPDSFWCETLVENANAARMRSVEIAAPPELVFRWLCQLRVAAYSYDWANSAERRSPRELLPGLGHRGTAHDHGADLRRRGVIGAAEREGVHRLAANPR